MFEIIAESFLFEGGYIVFDVCLVEGDSVVGVRVVSKV